MLSTKKLFALAALGCMLWVANKLNDTTLSVIALTKAHHQTLDVQAGETSNLQAQEETTSPEVKAMIIKTTRIMLLSCDDAYAHWSANIMQRGDQRGFTPEHINAVKEAALRSCKPN